MPVRDGWIVQDSNLLQCSEGHIRAVFAMLRSQPNRAEFTGGLQASLLQDWHIDLLVDLKSKKMFFAYDMPDDYEPLVIAGKKLQEAGFTLEGRVLRCYVLIGYPDDNMTDAEIRLEQTLDLGFTPMAMLWRNDKGETEQEWRKFQRLWARPAIIHSKRKVKI